MLSNKNFDVVVVGAGSAGVCAAFAASGAGASTAIIDSHKIVGGLSVHAQIGTICGLWKKDSADPFNPSVTGIANKMAKELMHQSGYAPDGFRGFTFLPYKTEALQFMYEDMLQDTTALMRDSAKAVTLGEDGITHLLLASGETIAAKAVVDATGDATLSTLAGQSPAFKAKQAGAFGFSMLPKPQPGMKEQLNAALVAIYRKVESGELHPDCKQLAFVPQSNPSRPVLMKLQANSMERAEVAADQIVRVLSDELDWQFHAKAGEVGERANALPHSAAILIGADVLGGRACEDGIANGFWPTEHWPEEGGKVAISPIGGEGFYQVPAGALRSQGISNLFFAGKGIGADPVAHSSCRVIGTCWQTGYAAGKLAATYACAGAFDETVKALRQEQAQPC